MRYLNKIVFIHSAHIPYAEIRLDGNVHFIGTQGVGKSTLLRAILFFYNADKNKLGIQREQKSFDDFYLPTPDAYIIYEVDSDNGRYFVMAFTSRGRCAFRFIDCPYDKRFFMDGQLNVDYEWGRISQKIGPKVYKSNIIRSYSDFRDIIYGNSHDRELRRFSIMESQKYENVPRTIQNIFLNQSLESRMIKTTIIDSMDFADDHVDLNFFRDKLKDFKLKYDDIWKWYKKERNGQVKVKVDADKVIYAYTGYEATRRAISELCGQLNYAYQRDRDLLPALQNTINEKQAQLATQKQRLAEESGKYDGERTKLNREEGKADELLRRTRSRRQHYQEINIDEIVQRSAHEGELRIRLQSLQKQIDALTDKDRDVKAKYEQLRRENLYILQQSQYEAQQRITALKEECLRAIQNRQDEANRQRNELRLRNQRLYADVDEKLRTTEQEHSDLRLRRIKVGNLNPFEAEMKENTDSWQRLVDRQHELQVSIVSLQKEIDKISNEMELSRSKLEAQANADIVSIEHEMEKPEEAIQQLQQLLESQKGSLIEWLGENVKGWEQSLGKVLDEKDVLYNTSLNPQKLSTDNGIYGISLQLDNIDRQVRTPRDIENQKQQQERKLEGLRKTIAERKAKLEADIEALWQKPKRQLKQLRLDRANAEAEQSTIPQRLEKLERDCALLQDKLNDRRKKETEDIDARIAQAQLQREALERNKATLREKENSETNKIDKDFNVQERKLTKDRDAQIQIINNELEQKTADMEKKDRELDARMDAELKGLGVDIEALNALRTESNQSEQELSYIEQHRPDLFSWQNDKRELFDHEQENRDRLKSIRLKLDDLKLKFEVRRQKLQTTIDSTAAEIAANEKRRDHLNESIADAEGFMASSTCPADISNIAAIATVKALKEIHRSLAEEIGLRQQKMEALKRAVNVFKSNFSAKNTFHFRIDFSLEQDYLDFAVDLNDFVSNQKIEEYRVRTSEEYANVLQQISLEVNNLIVHRSDIEGTIGDINRDFRENNFAGVIKNIELRASESNDQLMQLMFNINKFANEHAMDLGEMNLFSDESQRQKTNDLAVQLLMTLIDQLEAEKKRDLITLTDTFKLEFRVKENDQETEWTEKLTHVGSDGTDILVKAMVNIMLINVFKRKVSRRFGDFRLHCMMDEIGKLHPDNVRGILDFANKRNILLINSSPTTYNAEVYRYTYSLSKDEHSNTVVKRLLTIK